MLENIDQLIEVNLKLLYASKSQYMMRINFKDEFGFNLKNSKVFAEVLVDKGLVLMECNQGFRCDLTDFGKQIYENGGWIKSIETAEPFAKFHTEDTFDLNEKKTKQSFFKKIIVTSLIILIFCVLLTLITVEIFKNS
jgi:hypothetical protein